MKVIICEGTVEEIRELGLLQTKPEARTLVDIREAKEAVKKQKAEKVTKVLPDSEITEIIARRPFLRNRNTTAEDRKTIKELAKGVNPLNHAEIADLTGFSPSTVSRVLGGFIPIAARRTKPKKYTGYRKNKRTRTWSTRRIPDHKRMEVKKLIDQGDLTNTEIAYRTGVSITTILRIKKETKRFPKQPSIPPLPGDTKL
jgi:uncharacterized protein YerC